MRYIYVFLILIGFISARNGFSQDNHSFDYFLEQAKTYNESRDFDTAYHYIQKAIAIDSNSADAFFLSAIIYENLHDLEKANKSYSKAIKINPKPVYYNNRGINKAIKGKYSTAIVDYQEALKLDNKYKQAWFNKAVAHYKMGEIQQACKDAGKAYDLGLEVAKQFIDRNCN